MTAKLTHALEAHPILGLLGSVVSIIIGWVSWFVQHADDFTKLFGFVAAVFGMAAGYYTLRLQRRAWKRRKQQDDAENSDA